MALLTSGEAGGGAPCTKVPISLRLLTYCQRASVPRGWSSACWSCAVEAAGRAPVLWLLLLLQQPAALEGRPGANANASDRGGAWLVWPLRAPTASPSAWHIHLVVRGRSWRLLYCTRAEIDGKNVLSAQNWP